LFLLGVSPYTLDIANICPEPIDCVGNLVAQAFLGLVVQKLLIAHLPRGIVVKKLLMAQPLEIVVVGQATDNYRSLF